MKRLINKKLNRVLAVVLTIAALMTGQTAWAQSLWGAGTEADPYVINSVDDWNTFANSNNADTYWGSNVYVRLGANIPTDADIAASKSVTTMVGTSTSNCFQGTFDGFGHTLTVNLTHTGGGDAFAAPFKFLNGATIKRLHTAGTITTNGKMCAGIVGDIKGSVTIQNCQSSVTINTSVNGDGTHGGLAGRVESGKTLTITNCLFDGIMTGSSTNSCGGFVGWKEGSLTLNHCLQAGDLSGIGSDGGATFHRANSNFADFTTCYYKTAYGTAQGTQTNATGSALQALLGDGWEVNGSGDVVPIMAINPRDLAYATISGLQEQYYYTGSAINIAYTVKDANDQTLTKDQDYTVEFSPATVQESGVYTLTITGTGDETSGYFGTKSVTLFVVPSGTTASGTCGATGNENNVMWTYDDSSHTLTISGTGAMKDWHWLYPGAEAKPWDAYKTAITSVVIDDGVTNIGGYSFYGHTALASVTIGSGVTTIGEDAFENCSALEAIFIPANVTSIGSSAFDNCRSLDTVKGGSGVTSCGGFVFDDTDWLDTQKTEQTTDVIYFGKVALVAKDNVSGPVSIADGTVGIASAAFANSDITSITIPASVTNIGRQAFDYRTSLATVNFAEGSQLTTIGENAFEKCSALEAISIPASVTTIGAQAFDNCSALEAITIPASVTTIGAQAFNYCTSLATVNFAEGSQLATIGAQAFDYCTSLTAITIPASVTNIGDAAFHECTSLATVNFAEGSQLATIGAQAFDYCTSLTAITIPASVTTIGDAAFNNCILLATVKVLPTTPPTMGDNVFIYIGQDVTTGTKNFYFHGTAYNNGGYWGSMFNHQDAGNYNDFSGYTTTVIYGATFSDGATTSTEAICSEGTTKYFTEGTKVTLGHGDVPTGYVFTEYTVKDANDDDVTVTENAGDYTFDMPAGDVTVKAWKKDIASCDITVPNQTLEGPNNPFNAITYKFEFANNNYSNTDAHEFIEGMGVDVKDGSTPLTLGTDYEFGSVTYANGDPITDSQIGDECKVEIVGKGNYSGSKWKTFKVIAPDAGGTWGENDNLTWAFHDGMLTITGTGEMKAANSFTNYPWHGSANYIEAITIGEGITSIATYAFGSNGTVIPYGNVASVSLPSTLTTIGESAFAYSGLTSINIPASVTSIGGAAFNQCASLESVTLNNEVIIGSNALPSNASTTVTIANNLTLHNGTEEISGDITDMDKLNGKVLTRPTYSVTANQNPDPAKAGEYWSTFYHPVAGYTADENTKVYQGAVNTTSKKVELTEVPGREIPADKAVVLKSTSSAITLTRAETTQTLDGNELKGGSTVAEGYIPYTLAAKNNVLGFYKFVGAALNPNKAHLEIATPAQLAPAFFGFDGGGENTTAINEPESHQSHEFTGDYYTLDGRKLQGKPTQKGIYVRNGRKIIIK